MLLLCRKYLRDTDRQELARLAWRYTLECTESSLPDIHAEQDTEKRLDFLLTAHKIWNHGKTNFKANLVNGMLARAYRAFRQGKVILILELYFVVKFPRNFDIIQK